MCGNTEIRLAAFSSFFFSLSLFLLTTRSGIRGFFVIKYTSSACFNLAQNLFGLRLRLRVLFHTYLLFSWEKDYKLIK